MKKKVLALLLTFFCAFTVFGFAGCDQKATYHTILVTSSNERSGTVSGTGIYKNGESVKLTATPIGNNQFIAWSKNDVVTSKDTEFSFVVDSSTEGKYTALFSSTNLDYVVFQGASYQIVNLTLENPELSPSKVISAKIGTSVVNALYTQIGIIEDVEFPNTGIFTSAPFTKLEKIFYLTKTYYFSFTIVLEYSDQYGNKTTGEITTNLEVDFNNLINGNATVDNNIRKYSTDLYELTLTNENNINTINLNFKNLKTQTDWNSDMTQSLNLSFSYPFEIE